MKGWNEIPIFEDLEDLYYYIEHICPIIKEEKPRK